MYSSRLFSNLSEKDFLTLALQTFRNQAQHCSVYHKYLSHLSIDINQVKTLEQIPFLPIDFFKEHKVVTGEKASQQVFSSSGTTGMVSSKHFVQDIQLYKKSYQTAFEHFYGSPSSFAVLALLPSYLERSGSSLIFMVDDFIKQSKYQESGYFLRNHQDLYETLSRLKAQKIPTVLFGVTYALLDFIEEFRIRFPELIILETGGMKGRRKEMIREELHGLLKEGFGVPSIHSEYGMTELLSQAYSKGEGLFNCPSWMKVLVREVNDPFSYCKDQQSGGINVIDLANQYSCAFIATQDLGRKYTDGSFEVLGRFDQSDLRGCNLLVQ